jgi:uncharacterized protein YkwD
MWCFGERLRCTLGVVLVLLTAGAVSACGSAQTGRFGSGFERAPATAQVKREERRMAERLNRDRKANGLPPLRYDEELAEVARAHSLDMREHKFFAHDSPRTGSLQDRLDRAGYATLEARENLAEAPDVEQGQAGLLKSPRHYANIMADSVSRVGIGIVQGGVENASNLTITQVFAEPAKKESVAQARASLREAITRARRARGLEAAREDSKLTRLAEKHLDELDADPRSPALQRIGKRISAELAEQPVAGVRGISVSGQLLPDSTQFAVSDGLMRPSVSRYGIAVTRTRSGRPMLKVLLVIGLP